MVRVELTEFAPGVTDVAARAQVGIGASPAAAQVSWIALSKGPFNPVMVTTSLPCAPGCNVNFVCVGATEKSCRLKVAVADAAALMARLQVPVPEPEHAPLQPVKFDVAFAAAVSVTAVPGAKFPAQEVLQFMTSG
jgi:hypothetical protein